MKKKTKIFIGVAIISLLLTIFALFFIIKWMFSAQYNSNGISHFLVVTLDGSSRQYIGDLEGHKVYLEGLNKDETVFRSIDAKNISIKTALDDKLVSISEWKKYSLFKTKKEDHEILRFENYEIVIFDEIIIIRPLTK